MHNKMEGCFVTAPTTPWAGKELWYKQCGRAKYLPEEPPKGIVSCNIRWQELYVFLVYASRSLFVFFEDGSLQALKREREQDDSKFFSAASLSAYTPWVFFPCRIPLFTFSSLSLCIPGFVSFQDRRNLFYILAWPRNGENWERVVCSTPYRSLSFSLRLLPSSFAVAWNIKFPIRVCRLRTSFQEITSLF